MPGKIYQTAFKSYTELDSIGEGGSGRVYKVRDSDGDFYALKLLRNAVVARHDKTDLVLSQQKLKRFKNEVFFCIRTSHSKVLRVLDYGFTSEDGLHIPFCVMRYYPKTLRTLMKTKIPTDKILLHFAQVLDGVEAAHLSGICHRDLKPENILYDPQEDILVVADFGIAHFHEEYLETQVETRLGERLANFQYAAPEQKKKGSIVDQRADIFALGLILNEMFTGEVIQGSDPPLIKDQVVDCEYLDRIVQKMTSHRPENRYASIDQLKQDLMEHAEGIFFRQQIDKSTKEAVPSSRPQDPYIISLDRTLSTVQEDRHPLATLYYRFLKLIQDNNKQEVYRLRDQAVDSIGIITKDWRQRHEKNGLPQQVKKRSEAVDEAVALLGPLFILPLATIESRNPESFDIRTLLVDLVNPPGWQHAGIDIFYEFPYSLAFIFQSLYGAKSLATSQPELVFDLLKKTRIKLRREQEPKNIWNRNKIMIHPCTIGWEYVHIWDYIKEAPRRMEWLQSIFGTAERYEDALIAYTIALNIFELADLIASGEVERSINSNETSVPRITPYSLFEPPGPNDRAINLLTRNGKVLETCWSSLGVELDQMKLYWDAWMNKTRFWNSKAYPFLSDSPVPHEAILP